MNNSIFDLFLYISLGIQISSFITVLGLLLVNLPLRLAIDGPYIFSEFHISDTDIGQFDITFMNTIGLKFFTVGSPTLLYILLSNLALSICMLVNPTIFSSTVVTTLNISVVYGVLKTYSPSFFLLNLIIPLFV